MAAQANQIGYGTAAPTDTTQFYATGDIVINNAPVANQTYPYGWVCAAGGYPGTWYAMFNEPTRSLTTTITSGTLTNGYRLILTNAGAGSSLSLPDVSAVAAGGLLTVKQIANQNLTLAPIAANGYDDAAAITLTQHQVVTLISSGGTTWYKQS